MMKKTLFTTILSIAVLFGVSAFGQTPLPKLDGGTVDLQGQNGKVVVAAIGASWLPLSDKHAEYAAALAKKYAGKNVVFYYVVTDSSNARSKNYASDEAVRKFAAANKLSLTILRDSDGQVINKNFKVDQVPSFLIIDRTGKQSGEVFGGIDPSYDITIPISKKIDSLL